MAREPSKPKAKGPGKPGPQAQNKWDLLDALADRGGREYLSLLCKAIDSEEAIPTSALRRLSTGLRHLIDGDLAAKERMKQFAVALGTNGARGRPRIDEKKYWRAFNYWTLRYGEGMSDSEAIEFLERKGLVTTFEEGSSLEYLEESSIRKAIRAWPHAEVLAKEVAGI